MSNDKSGKFNSGTILTAFFAILVGLVGVYTVRIAMAQSPVVQPPEPPPEPPPAPPEKPARITVPLASRDIAPGTRVTLDDIALYRLTREEIKEYVKAKNFMANPEQIIGKIVGEGISSGKHFDTKNFLPSGKLPSYVGRLKPGFRAVTVSMTPSNALLGFAGPGNFVDVLFHFGADGASAGAKGGPDAGYTPGHHDFNAPRRRDYYGDTIGGAEGGLDSWEYKNATSTLVQNVEILAVGTQSTPTDLASPMPEEEELVKITLAVAPRQAEMLRVASGHGDLSLTLRAEEDKEQVNLVDPVTVQHIIDVDHTIHEMEIYRGKSLSKVVFGADHSIRTRVFTPEPSSPEPSSDPAHHSNQTTTVSTHAPTSGGAEPGQQNAGGNRSAQVESRP